MILGLLKVRFAIVTMVTKVTIKLQWPDYVIKSMAVGRTKNPGLQVIMW